MPLWRLRIHCIGLGASTQYKEESPCLDWITVRLVVDWLLDWRDLQDVGEC